MIDEDPEAPAEPIERICPFCKDIILYCECERKDPSRADKNSEQ